VSRAAPELGGLAGVIFISAVFEPPFLDDARWQNQNVLVIYGEADERIPRDYTESAMRALSKSGAILSDRRYPNEDHFLFYSQRREVLKAIADWMLRR
jgi:dipeptidyl aminopeptidase/acylaminoacyl peptidase